MDAGVGPVFVGVGTAVGPGVSFVGAADDTSVACSKVGVGAAVASGAGELAGVVVGASVGARVGGSGVGESAGNGVVVALRFGGDVGGDHGVAVGSGGLIKTPSGADVRTQRPGPLPGGVPSTSTPSHIVRMLLSYRMWKWTSSGRNSVSH